MNSRTVDRRRKNIAVNRPYTHSTAPLLSSRLLSAFGGRGYTLIELMISIALSAILVLAVTQATGSMLQASKFADNDFLASSHNRMLQMEITNCLKQARLTTITLSGASQTLMVEVCKNPAINATVDVYPEVTFEEPVAFDYASERVIWSNDPDAPSFCDSGHRLYPYLPCMTRIRRDSSIGHMVIEYIQSGSVIPGKTSLACDEFSTVEDDSGNPLMGLGFYFYPTTPLHLSIGAMVATSAGDPDNPMNVWAGYASKTKIIPKN